MSRGYHVSKKIAASSEAIWALLTEVSAYPSWNDSVVSLEGQIREGATIELVSVVDPNRTFELRVTELSPTSRMVWSDGMPLGLFTGTRTFEVETIDDTTCRFSMTETFEGPLAPLISRFVPDLTESFELFAESLRRAAEGT